MEARLTTDFWVRALVHRANIGGLSAVMVRRGDPVAGAVLIRVDRRAEGITVYSQTRTQAGEKAWLRGTGPSPVDSPTADAYVERQLRYDSDLWVVEVDDVHGRFALDEPVID